MLALFPASGLVKRVVVTGVKRGHAGTASLPRLGAYLSPGTAPPRLHRRDTTCRTLTHALQSVYDGAGGGGAAGAAWLAWRRADEALWEGTQRRGRVAGGGSA